MNTPVASLFAGQGAQVPGMGKSLYETSPAARRVFDEACTALGFDVRALCFDGPSERLRETRASQPAILTMTVAAYRALLERVPSFSPRVGAGLSLGEFSALVCAGWLPLSDGLRMIARRAELMHEAAQARAGAMACVIGLPAARIQQACAEELPGVEAVNLNAPDQTVVSGPVEALKSAPEVLKRLGAKRVIMLEVSGAFHSSLMRGAAETFGRFLSTVKFIPGAYPVVGNVEAAPLALARLPQLLELQMHSPVLWEQSVRAMRNMGCGVFVEFGPGKVLSGLCRKIDPAIRCVNVEDKDSLEVACAALQEA